MSRISGRRNALCAVLTLVACTAPNPRYGAEVVPDAGEIPSDAAPAPDARALLEVALDAPTEAAPAGGGLGDACTAPAGCLSGFCVDGVCCESACRERCRSCGLEGERGTCALIPAGADPRLECVAQDPVTCGRAGGCDGHGDCQLHPAGTECRARSCSAGVELGAALCDGVGTCSPGTPMACALRECTGDRCTVGCTASSCPSGFLCQAGKCAGAPPALHWRFDESSGTTAADTSPNGFTGIYRGEGALPTPSASVPSRIRFPNPGSLQFGPTGNPAVQLAAVTGALRPSRTVTVSVWFRANRVAAAGSDLVNLGEDYLIRVRATDMEFAKRRSDVEGQLYQLAWARDLTGHLDGNWHHVAGVISATSVNLYYDGKLLISRPSADPILYRGSDLWAGRSGASNQHAFQGGLDDLRIYARDLSEQEILQLAAGEL